MESLLEKPMEKVDIIKLNLYTSFAKIVTVLPPILDVLKMIIWNTNPRPMTPTQKRAQLVSIKSWPRPMQSGPTPG